MAGQGLLQGPDSSKHQAARSSLPPWRQDVAGEPMQCPLTSGSRRALHAVQRPVHFLGSSFAEPARIVSPRPAGGCETTPTWLLLGRAWCPAATPEGSAGPSSSPTSATQLPGYPQTQLNTPLLKPSTVLPAALAPRPLGHLVCRGNFQPHPTSKCGLVYPGPYALGLPPDSWALEQSHSFRVVRPISQ